MTDTKGNVALGPRSPRFPSSKFSAPRPAPHLVHRSRLLDELDRGQGARLTLVVGSAGAGKTALLADWVAAAPERQSRGLAVTSPTPSRSVLSPPSSKPSDAPPANPTSGRTPVNCWPSTVRSLPMSLPPWPTTCSGRAGPQSWWSMTFI